MRFLQKALAGAVLLGMSTSTVAVAGPFTPGPTLPPEQPPLRSGVHTPPGPPLPGYLPPPDIVPSKEYSNGNCEIGAAAGPTPPAGACPNGTLGDRSAAGPAFADSGQVIGWDGRRPGGVADWTDFSSTIPGFSNELQIDGLANNRDAFFYDVEADGVHLLFSTDADENIYYETPGAAVGGIWAFGHPPFVPGVNDGNDIDQHGVNDVDGLEIWGPNNPEAADADRFSLESGTHDTSADPLGVAVWESPGPGGPATPLWDIAELAIIASAVSGFTLPVDLIDLDAMMSFENDLIFSLDPIEGLLDGGEIFVAHRGGGFGTFSFGAGDTAHYLFHGGHVWDTAFDVRGTYNTASENINALEAAHATPEPATLALAGVALAGLAYAGRRRS